VPGSPVQTRPRSASSCTCAWGKEEFVLQGGEVVIVELELELKGPIRLGAPGAGAWLSPWSRISSKVIAHPP